MTLRALRAELGAGRVTPETLVAQAYEHLARLDDSVVISLVPSEVALARARALADVDPGGMPLWGVPFAVKDNIDVAGVPTTVACPAFASTPAQSATVVRRLEAAGAVLIAKTNLDQFATGLVGTRSPYGTPRNPFDASRVPGGSSSGSAVAVAHGAVPFALGTDTAGSGRVPAALCGVVGAKPTRGWLSTAGVVPAIRSVDCVSVFALSVDDAWAVMDAAGGWDFDDPYSRPGSAGSALEPGSCRIGVDPLPADAVACLVGQALASAGLAGVPVDLDPFLAAGDMLYGGPWLAERFAAVGAFIGAHPGEVDPTVASIIARGAGWSAADFAVAGYELAALRRRVDAVWQQVDVLVLPTVGLHPTLADVEADPIGVNAALGRYTTFANLLDLCAVAVPTGLRRGLPTGVSVVGPAWADAVVAAVAARIHVATGGLCGVTSEVVTDPWVSPGVGGAVGVELVVAGAHLRGMPLHHQLVALGATFVEATTTAPIYRLYALAGTVPPKPGLVRVDDGTGVEVEVYRLSHEAFGRFAADVAAPMCIGKVVLADRTLPGFLCEPAALEGAQDITAFGGWRSYMESRRP